MDYAYKPTTNGRAVMAACMALEAPFKITRVAFGSGKVDEETNLADVHELLEYASDGAVAERRHEDDRFYLTIQYANIQHQGVKTFLLSEFIVYVEDPANGGETDLLYGTLGDYRQPVPAYNPAFPPSVFNFPLILILSDEINISVSAPMGLATYDDLQRKIAEHNADPNAHGGTIADAVNAKMEEMANGGEIATSEAVKGIVSGHDGSEESHADLRKAISDLEAKVGGGVVRAERLDLAIPIEGWEADTDTNGAYPFHLDIANARVEEDTVPIVTILPTSLADASACGLCPTAATGPGYLRFYAKAAPTSAIAVSAVLIGDVRGCEDITIPTSGWVADEDTGRAYPLRIDIASTVASEALTPMLTILPGSLETAGDCGLCPAVRTLDGILRLYAKEAPKKAIYAKLSLLGTDFPAPASTSGNMPIASRTTPGGVILGEDFDIDGKGVMSINREKVITADDLVDEEEVRQDIVTALNAEDEEK